MSYGAIEQEEIFAGGEWLTPHAAARIELESPVDFRRTGGAVDGDERDVDTAVRAAREAFDHGPWPRMSPEERAGWLERLADEIERRADATVSLVTTEIGQPVSIARPWAGHPAHRTPAVLRAAAPSPRRGRGGAGERDEAGHHDRAA